MPTNAPILSSDFLQLANHPLSGKTLVEVRITGGSAPVLETCSLSPEFSTSLAWPSGPGMLRATFHDGSKYDLPITTPGMALVDGRQAL